jgi:hypothetical protein
MCRNGCVEKVRVQKENDISITYISLFPRVLEATLCLEWRLAPAKPAQASLGFRVAQSEAPSFLLPIDLLRKFKKIAKNALK